MQCIFVFLVNLCIPPCLLVSNTSDIIAIDYNASTVTPVVTGLSRAVAIDVHFSLGYIFWSDETDLNIKRFHIGGSATTIITGIRICNGMAVHWRASQLHWTDRVYDKISVSDLNGNNQNNLIYSELDSPRDIALDPDKGYLLRTCILIIMLAEFCLFETHTCKKLLNQAMSGTLTYLVEVTGFIIAELQRAKRARKAQ